MNTKSLIHAFVFISFYCTTGIFAQNQTKSEITQDNENFAFHLEPKMFKNNENFQHNKEFVEGKNSYKIVNKDYAKGVLVKYKGSWKRHGLYYQFSGGKKSSVTSYRYGIKSGQFTRFHSNGEKSEQGVYKENLKDGTWYNWNADGKKKSEIPWVNGDRKGEVIDYHSDGITPKFITTFDNNERNGRRTYYDDNGKLISTSVWKDNERVGPTIYEEN